MAAVGMSNSGVDTMAAPVLCSAAPRHGLSAGLPWLWLPAAFTAVPPRPQNISILC